MIKKSIIGWAIVFVVIAAAILYFGRRTAEKQEKTAITPAKTTDSLWVAPDFNQIPISEEGDLIRYGRLLISNTAEFFGPGGKIGHDANGMNCQNCHLEAGTKPWGNNYGAVFATYPKFRERRGAVENIPQRINDCFQRSLNGKGLDTNSREMHAILAYFQWLGKGLPKGKKPPGSGIRILAFLDRAADPQKGKLVYADKCQRCHGVEGQGILRPDIREYVYPPLWGPYSFNSGAGLFRISRMAGYIKDNMPFDAKKPEDKLSIEACWDVAAFVISQPRTEKKFQKDWPDISLKPVDHPYGPYLDSFKELQHKYGPFGPVQKEKDRITKKKNT
jgi:thiosulfate dehydrogenase